MVFRTAGGYSVRFGGFNPGPLVGDNTDTLTLGQIWNPSAFSPRRVSEGMAYDATRNQVVMFGGEDGSRHDYSQTWQWSGSWSQIMISGPSARAGVGMAYDSDRGVTVLFGGLHFATPNVFYADTWELGAPCYANCDNSTSAPILNINDFICFQTKFAAGDSYANCDNSTSAPVLNINDFICFQTRYAQGCN